MERMGGQAELRLLCVKWLSLPKAHGLVITEPAYPSYASLRMTASMNPGVRQDLMPTI